MTRPLLALPLLALLGAPAAAQAPDFGADTSPWAGDGECDDPRFEGPGMATGPLVEADAMADASDCAAAFAQGAIALAGTAGGGKGEGTGEGTGGGTGGDTGEDTGAAGAGGGPVPPPLPAAVDFGDDSGDWARDGECDDRRFRGPGMAASLTWLDAGRDATDCRSLYDAGQVSVWDWDGARAATQCDAVDFGDDSGDYAGDGECDDIRFEGPAMASGVGPALVGRDATDCARQCRYGTVALRDY